jgi:hypothetical protein
MCVRRMQRARQSNCNDDSLDTWTRLQPVQFEWEEEPQLRAVRLVSGSAQVGDPGACDGCWGRGVRSHRGCRVPDIASACRSAVLSRVELAR